MAEQGLQLAIVDRSLTDYQQIIDELPPATELLLVDSTTAEGLDLLLADLAAYQNLSAIHLFSHSSAGQLNLAGTDISADNIDQFQQTLQKLGASLSDTGDLLVYGCDLASGEGGENFVNQLAEYTGADIAASTDLTGAAALGGNWQLEYHAGEIEHSAIENSHWQGLLNTYLDTNPGGIVYTDTFGAGDVDNYTKGPNFTRKQFLLNETGSYTFKGVVESGGTKQDATDVIPIQIASGYTIDSYSGTASHGGEFGAAPKVYIEDRKSTRLNSSH